MPHFKLKLFESDLDDPIQFVCTTCESEIILTSNQLDQHSIAVHHSTEFTVDSTSISLGRD